MTLTSMDIRNKEFKKSLRGYSVDEVDEFLDVVVKDYEEVYKENSKLRDDLSMANEKKEYYESLETAIQNALILAEKTANQAKQNSQKEADFIIANANETAQRILDKAHGDVVAINDEYERVKEEFIKFRAKFRGFMNTQLQTFDELEKDLTKNYNVSEPIEKYELKEKEAITTEVESKEVLNTEVFKDDMAEIKSFNAQ